MQTVLAVLSDELRRLKAAGVESLAVSDESLAALRRAVRARAATAGPSPVSAVAERASVSLGGGAARLGPPVGLGGPGRPALPETKRLRVPPSEPSPGGRRPPSDPGTLPPPPKVALPAGSKQQRWDALHGLVQADPTCRAHVRPGKQVVLGVGNLAARLMFVGEAPGAEEEVQGEPFVGPAGQLLNKMIGAMGLQRSEVYIGNIMNWRPELPAGADGVQWGNRPPTAEEMAYCLPYLRAQIEVVDPEILVALGATAAQGLLGAGSFRALGEVRGRWHDFGGKPLLVTYHPSYILRNPTNRSKRMIWEDFLKVMGRAGLPVSERQQGYFLEK